MFVHSRTGALQRVYRHACAVQYSLSLETKRVPEARIAARGRLFANALCGRNVTFVLWPVCALCSQKIDARFALICSTFAWRRCHLLPSSFHARAGPTVLLLCQRAMRCVTSHSMGASTRVPPSVTTRSVRRAK